MRVTKHCHRLPIEVVEAPPLEILKTLLDMVQGNLLSLTLLEQRVRDLQRSLPTSTIL